MTSESHVIERVQLAASHNPSRSIGVRTERAAGMPERRPFAVLCHGFKGFMDWGFFPALSTAFAEAGFLAVSLNASGCGIGNDPLIMSDEAAFRDDTYTKQLSDIAQVRAWAAAHPAALPGREVLFGHSRGGGMAVISAAEQAPQALVTWAAFDDADRFDEETKAAWRRDGEIQIPNGRTGQIHRIGMGALEDLEANRGRLSVLAAAGRLAVPYLVVHGTDDSTVEVGAARRLLDAAPGAEEFILEGADHGFGARHPMPPTLGGFPDLGRAVATTLAFALRSVGPLE